MKHMLIFICTLLYAPFVEAGWFSPDPIPEYKEKITSLENQLAAQNRNLNRWQIVAGSLAIGCVLVLVIGTSLGASTRKHFNYGTGRMGSTPPPPSTTGLNGRKPRIVGKADQENSHTHWQPKPLSPPVVDADLPELSAIERAAEVLRYTLSRLFFWMAPGGSLKEWMRFNLRAAFIIGVPLALVGPIITFGLGQIQLWIDLLAKTTSNLILFPLSVLLIIGLCSGLVFIGRSLLIIRLRYSQQRRDPYGY